MKLRREDGQALVLATTSNPNRATSEFPPSS
jgi:hypothetical protein